ncbi:response regulator receiver domain-containing protein [Hoeflea halophila]|uniref:Response regulator receiver domain-containing protein n=1 Tax=Hoeflea halophila TaxID=714899 RepID=A0A286HY12_9HYPH|nr:response regulator [Hoeflea halophila]SOE12014.1 response regulator receiver domain-containing protein [Hoeflea halophila]
MNADMTRKSMSVLVVEDESLIAMNLEMILEDLGHSVIGPVMTLRNLEKLLDGDFHADAAILDVNIAGEPIFPYARRLADLGVPLIFASGYGASGIRDDLAHYPVVPKPYTELDIARMLDRIFPA